MQPPCSPAQPPPPDGEADRFPSAEAIGEWANAVPGARLVVLPLVGHYRQAEDPDALFDAVDAFLASG